MRISEMPDNEEALKVIEGFGGISALARFFELTPPAIYAWKKKGLPKTTKKYLKLFRPALFKPNKD